MIFATDLDRTLIYSHLFLDEADCEYELIEKKGEKPIAYMSKKAIGLLEELHTKAHIIPITLRNETEFHRIDLFKKNIVPEIFVTNNGGTIYYKGQEDKSWTNHINEQMVKMPISHEKIKGQFLNHYHGLIEKEVNCGNLIWLFMGERDHIDYEAVQSFESTFKDTGWRIDVSGRKIYVYPYFVTKWCALSYIKENYFKEEIFAAGDSIFDMEMVEKADYGMIPKASYIEEQIKDHVMITNHKGMRAAEDILAKVIEIVEEKEI